MFSIYDLIQNKMSERNKREPKPADVWWASDTLKCHRKRYWKRQGLRGEPLSPSVLRQLSLGSTVHDWAENLVKGSPEIIGIEVKVVWTPGNVRGRCDLVFKYVPDSLPPPTIYGIADIKSVHPFVFKMISEQRYQSQKQQFVMFDEEEETKPVLEIDVMADRTKVEACQIALYKLGLDESKTFPETFSEGRLVYVNRADLGIIEIPFKLDDYIPKVIDDYQRLNAAWESKQVPPVLDLAKGGKISKECQYCEFRSKCRDELKAKITAWKAEDKIGPVRRLII